MDILKELLIGKYAKISTCNGNVYFGKISMFHKHIDGGLCIEGGICLNNPNKVINGIVCKLCIPELGQTNYTTSINIKDNLLILNHQPYNPTPREDKILIDVIELLKEN